MEQAGFAPQSPGMVNTGQQMLLDQTGIVPHFAPGGKVVKGILSALEREANKAKFLEGTKVVDYNGKPITMYHHTTNFQGDAFNPALAQEKDVGYHGKGMYFGADDYLKRSAFGKHSSGNVYGEEGFTEGSQVMPVHLNLKNPKYVDITDQSLHGMSIEKLKEMGHDGVIVTRDDSFRNAMGRDIPRQKIYNAVAFEPTQVKSSIGNEGTFDPTDPRLYKAAGGSINQQDMSPQDMLAMLMVYGQAPQHFASGSSVTPTNDQFERILELAKRDPSFLKKLSSRTLGLLGKAFDKLNPAFQGMAAIDAGERGMDAAERAYQGDYRGAAISGLGALGAGVGMLPGGIPQVLSIPATMGADYLQEHYDETDPHRSRSVLKNTTLNK
jgi:hypothetical protein